MFLVYFWTQKGYRCWNPISIKYEIYVNVTFFENTSYFPASLGSTITPSITHVTLPVPLEDSPPLQVSQQRKKITTDLDSLPPHQLIDTTEVSELPIAL